jgi:hypothetical protein
MALVAGPSRCFQVDGVSATLLSVALAGIVSFVFGRVLR